MFHRIRRPGIIGISFYVLVLGSALAASAQDSTTVQTIRSIVTSANHPDLKWPDFPHYEDEMRGLYEPGGFGPIWFAGGEARKQVGDVIAEVGQAPLRGLDPSDYDFEYLNTAWTSLQGGKTLSPRELALFDTGLTLSLLRTISDLRIGRITPRRAGVTIETSAKKYDLVSLVRGAIDGDRIRATVENAEPRLAVYRRMKEALASYREVAATSLPSVQSATTVKPGNSFDGLPALRARLRAFGDLPKTASAADPPTYDAETEAAVKSYQARHGLTPDGAIGKGTLASLNVTPARRLRQIELGLERLRWVPDVTGGRFLVVNIPAFQLWGWDSVRADGRPSLSMRVVVGKAFKHETPVFYEQMEYVVFRPYWNVPYSIVKTELLPSVRRDHSYLNRKNMEIVRDFGAPPGGLPVTSENISKLASGALKIREKPGPKNALGLAKFIFPNSSNVYLHGTPSQAAFDKERRDLSHGCVRLENPTAMAQFVLADQPEWTLEKITAAMNASSPQTVHLKHDIPVLLFYTTALVDLEGKLHFYDDIYGHDKELEKELDSAYSFQP